MPIRLSVCVTLCLLLAAFEVVAQEATPASSPTSAPASMPQDQEKIVETVDLEIEQERLEKKTGISLRNLTPELRRELAEKGVFSERDLALLPLMDAKQQAEDVQKYSKSIKVRSWVVGGVGHTLRLPVSLLVGGVAEALFCADLFGPCFETTFLSGGITGSLFSSLVINQLQEKGLPNTPAKQKRLRKYALLHLASPAAFYIMGGLVGVAITGSLAEEEFAEFALSIAGAAELVVPPVITYLHYKAIKRDLLSTPSKQSTLPEKQARLQLDLSPVVLPTYDGKLSTGLGIVGSW